MSNYQLLEDERIRSQAFCCISFIDPVPNHQLHDEECMAKFINDRLGKQPAVLSEISSDEIKSDYRVYYQVHYNDIVKTLPERFHTQTHNKGIKIRGVYGTMEEAKNRITYLSETMKNEPIHIYIAENGKWVPFMTKDMSADIGTHLNFTLFDYQNQVLVAKVAFNKRMETARSESKAHVEEINDDEDEDESTTESKFDKIMPFDETKDYLEEDRVVDNQKFMCVSFIEPSVEVEEYMYDTCIKSFIHSYLLKQNDDYYTLNADLEKVAYEVTLNESYEMYLEFKKDIENTHTSTRVPCFKLRGCFSSEKEASEQSEYLQKIDGSVDIYVAHVGFWLPFAAPNKDDIQSVYNEQGLNEIHTTLNDHKRKIEENKQRMRGMNFDPDATNYGEKKIQQLAKNVHPVEL
jgi:hypothetical protein